ncbi:MAG: SRPBCC domain-containing protein [Deltaproteobacteria bacterium]|nr:SRPBCC domain-containing protein [Candidatus Zymogenaceae bacterium]
MKRIETFTDIDATPQAVWDILTDFAEYGRWNPFIPEISGTPAEGETLTVTISPPGGRNMTFTPRVRAAHPHREFAWLGHLFIPGLFDGEHRFLIEKRGDKGTRLTQREEFRGVLVGMFWKSLEPSTRRGFEAMNAALKLRAEGG